MDRGTVEQLIEEYGSPLYIFDEHGFRENYQKLEKTFRRSYENYRISYSFKTNYTPYIINTVKELGGYAEVVSGMEYYIAKKIGYSDDKIIFNGPNKKESGKKAFLCGCILNVDSLSELREICDVAKAHAEKNFNVGIRVNLDVGQDFISRFGIDSKDLAQGFQMVDEVSNLKIVGLHCHISRCRGLDAWKKRTQIMLSIADQYFLEPPQYIDLGSGMFGDMAPEFAAQFTNVPTYEEYALVTAALLDEHYKNFENKPILFTEPGTTLVNKFVDFVATVDVIKEIRGEYFAVLNCSEHNLGETCTLKELPITVLNANEGVYYPRIHFAGYTCLEQDIMRKNVSCNLSVGDHVVFGNVGGYSNVLKPPFIWPNCRMVTYDSGAKKSQIIKNAESYDDILNTYVFLEGIIMT
jgi:diaminopimelate decarboxylase